MTESGRSSAREDVVVPGRPSAITIAWGAVSDVGHKRRLNEDSYLAEVPIFAVADGMGGHASGDVASAAVVRRLGEAGPGGFTDPERILTALRAATVDISGADDADELGVGTTATGVALTLQNGLPYWIVFNVGDSRVYRFAADTLEQITVDHSVVQELVASGRISAEEAEFHPDSNVITRAVGFGAEPKPDMWMLPVRQGDRLLVCSDGLTKEVSPATIRQHLAAGFPAHETAASLVETALISGGRDNITTVVVDVISSDDASDFDITARRGATSR